MCCRCRHNRISLLTDESATTVAKRATQSIISSWLIASLKRARLKNRLSGPTWRAPADSDVISHRKRRRRATDKCAAASTQYSTSILSSCDEMKYRSTDNTRAQMILLFYSRLELNDDIMSLKMKQTKTVFASFCCSSAWRGKQLQNNSLGSGGSLMEITSLTCRMAIKSEYLSPHACPVRQLPLPAWCSLRMARLAPLCICGRRQWHYSLSFLNLIRWRRKAINFHDQPHCTCRRHPCDFQPCFSTFTVLPPPNRSGLNSPFL